MLRRLALLCTALLVTSCANEEQEQMLAQLQTDLNSANAAIDSLTYTLDDSNLLLDAMRAKADSAQSVNEKLIRDVQGLNKSLREFRNLADQRKADSLNGVLLEAHTSIRRQSDHIRQLEMDLAQTQDQVSTLKAAQRSVRLYAAGEKFLEENGYLDTSRPFGRAFRKQYKLVKRIDPEDPAVILAPLGTEIIIEGKVKELADRYGTLKKGEDYTLSTADGQSTVTFLNELITGTDILAVVEN